MFKKLIMYLVICVCLDQFSKMAITFFMNINQSITIIPNFFNITYVTNTGAAFSILSGFRVVFIIVSIIALNIIYLYFIKDKNLKNYEIVLYGFLLGGIIGNLIDRVLFGYIIDFLAFQFFNYQFAIFNIADASIVVATVILLLLSFRGETCKNT